MINNMVNIPCFTPSCYLRGLENLYKSFFVPTFVMLTLSGCITSNKSDPLALMPPVVSLQSINDQSKLQASYHLNSTIKNDAISSNVIDKPHSVFIEREDDNLRAIGDIKVALDDKNNKKSNKKCRIKDRFDRKAILAYEWGYKRIALDVDGVNLKGNSRKGIKLEYKMNLQRKKKKIQKCRYKSKWQGLIGSGYHEMFVRENDTVWGELRSIKSKVTNYMDNAF